MNLQRMRGFLLLTLRDVENGAGVPAYRLSKAERGQLQLNDAEQAALCSYYTARWRMAVSDEIPTELLLKR